MFRQILNILMRFIYIVVRNWSGCVVDRHFIPLNSSSVFLNENVLLNFRHLVILWNTNLLINDLQSLADSVY